MCLFSLHVGDACSIEAESSDIQFACQSGIWYKEDWKESYLKEWFDVFKGNTRIYFLAERETIKLSLYSKCEAMARYWRAQLSVQTRNKIAWICSKVTKLTNQCLLRSPIHMFYLISSNCAKTVWQCVSWLEPITRATFNPNKIQKNIPSKLQLCHPKSTERYFCIALARPSNESITKAVLRSFEETCRSTQKPQEGGVLVEIFARKWISKFPKISNVSFKGV